MNEDMNDRERAHVQAAYEAGVESITPQDLEKVMKDSAAAEAKGGRLGKQFENFKLLWSLLKDYYNKTYPHAPWKLIAAIVFAVLYLISPIDVIPDAIPILGFIDDAFVFSLVIAGFQSEIDDYKVWLAAKKSASSGEISTTN